MTPDSFYASPVHLIFEENVLSKGVIHLCLMLASTSGRVCMIWSGSTKHTWGGVEGKCCEGWEGEEVGGG